MKKLLLATTALVGVVMMTAPASAAVKLDLGGFFRGYGVFADSDEGGNMHDFDLRRHTEVHVSGETTLDNGLTVGFHTEQALGDDGTASATLTDEAYAYFSGGWGRLNVGSEDGASYLLQVAAPSADSNVDGQRVYIQALNPAGAATTSALTTAFTAGLDGLRRNMTIDYDHVSDSVHNTERLTYLTPKYSGFQAGVSFAPTSGQQATATALFPLTTDNDIGDYHNIWEAGLRWDGEYQGFGISLGGGYSNADQEQDDTLVAGAGTEDSAPVVDDGLTKWNLGANLAWSGFSLGGGWMREETSNLDVIEVTDASTVFATRSIDVTQDTWVVGLGWDNGPWHLGASYLDQNQERDGSGVAADGGEVGSLDATTTKFTVGGGYTFGPGMTFRGAVAWGEFDSSAVANDAGTTDGVALAAGPTAAASDNFQQVTIGTDIQF